MNNYELPVELNQKLVDGLMEGYRDYLEVRREKSRSMKISSAYAWVKGNHIDDQIARACEACGVESQLAKAGVTWQYLQFKYYDQRVLFIVKNARYFNKEQVDQGKDAHGRAQQTKLSYMTNLMRINAGIDFKNIKTVKHVQSTQLKLFEDTYLSEEVNKEMEKAEKNYDRFYIITYEIDENLLISNISLLMPNPNDNKAYIVDDLTKYIHPSHNIVMDDELKEVLSNSVATDENFDAFHFNIGIDEAAEKGQN